MINGRPGKSATNRTVKIRKYRGNTINGMKRLALKGLEKVGGNKQLNSR